jgi:hypothetical protein
MRSHLVGWDKLECAKGGHAMAPPPSFFQFLFDTGHAIAPPGKPLDMYVSIIAHVVLRAAASRIVGIERRAFRV